MDNKSWDKVLFDYCEGNINNEAKAIVEEEIQRDPLARNELKRWKAAYVNESATLTFNHKTSLYQPTGIIGLYKRNTKIFWSSITALIGILSFFIIQTQKTQIDNTTVETNSRQVKSIIVIEKPKDSTEVKENTNEIVSKPIKKIQPKQSIQEPVKTILTPVKSQADSNEIKIEQIDLTKTITSDSLGVTSSNLSPESTIEKSNSEGKIKKKRVKKKKQRIKWKDIKESWGNKPSVVPMD